MSEISIKKFAKLDLRIGTVVSAVVPEWSHWVMKLEVDFGKKLGKKVCFAGIMKFFKPSDLKGKQFPFVYNLEPKKIGPEGDFSETMMLMAVPKDDEETPPVPLTLKEKVPNGTKIS